MSLLEEPTALLEQHWVRVAHVDDFPSDAGACVKVAGQQVAVFNFAASGEWYACQNMCPHRGDMVLARGLIGDQNGTPKVACPQHKKTFSLCDGQSLSGDDYCIKTYEIRVEDGYVYVSAEPLSP